MMPDREKVIKGLEECNQYGSNCKVCPYYDPEDDGGCHSEELMTDALALLKEQEAVVMCKDCIYGDDFDCPAPLPTGYLCQKGHGSHTGDWFCADGGKR